MQKFHKPSLCWDCKKTDCAWMLNLQPVAGWYAEKTIIPSKRLKLQSYHVFGCPEFVGTPRIKTKKRPPLTAQGTDKQKTQ